MLKKNITIINKLGLHARAAAKLVNCASHYASHIELTNNDKTVNGKSIMGVMTLAATQDTEIELRVDGEDEEQAMTALVELINNRFDERE